MDDGIKLLTFGGRVEEVYSIAKNFPFLSFNNQLHACKCQMLKPRISANDYKAMSWGFHTSFFNNKKYELNNFYDIADLGV